MTRCFVLPAVMAASFIFAVAPCQSHGGAPRFHQTPPPASFAAPVVYVPAQTRVVVLPVINASGEKDKKQKSDQESVGTNELTKQFRERGFQVTDAALVHKTLADNQIDLTDEESHNRATLYRAGELTQADVIVFVVITNVDQRRVQTTNGGDDQKLEARANVKIWLLDMKQKRALLSAYHQEAQSKNDLFPTLDSGARRVRRSVEGAIRDALKEPLKPYPVVKSK